MNIIEIHRVPTHDYTFTWFGEKIFFNPAIPFKLSWKWQLNSTIIHVKKVIKGQQFRIKLWKSEKKWNFHLLSDLNIDIADIMNFASAFFSIFLVYLTLISAEIFEPSFLASSDLESFLNKSKIQKGSTSPFYQHERTIINLVQNLLIRRDEHRIFQLLSNVIALEKSWRLHLCIRVFGLQSCKSEMSSEPFYLWKKALIHNLRQDPTKEITKRIWQSL